MVVPDQIASGIHIVAGPGITDNRDALAYLVEDQGELALIDVGAGPSYPQVVANIRKSGLDPARLKYVIATHGHIDHIGALADFARDYSPVIVAHVLDAPAIETGDPVLTAANWYGLSIEPVVVTLKIEEPEARLPLGGSELICLHIPGHTPGSIALYLDRDGKRFLFGQDIHGPFDKSFRSDIHAWRRSMDALLALKADVLAEGHYGVYIGKEEVADFIKGFLDRLGG